MSLYEGLEVETAPIPEISVNKADQFVSLSSSDNVSGNKSLSGWSSGLKLMASQLQRNKKAMKAAQHQKPRSQPSTAVLESLSVQAKTSASEKVKPEDLYEDDLAVEIEDEYDPAIPNSYEQVVKERRLERDRIREEERKRRREEREKERHRRRKRSDGSSSGSDDESRLTTKRKDSAAIPPPSSLSTTVNLEPKSEDRGSKVVRSALEELSKTKAQKANPFAKPKMIGSSFASKIMSKYGWEEGKGLGKASQGISTALSVEKTSKRGGKIVNLAAEQEQLLEEEKKKAQSMAELMKNPTKVVLLQNMVGPGDVDEDLQPEVAEECAKYGEVERCLIFEIPHGVSEEEAVRIFVAFNRMEAAIKAVIDLNGRFFGGRIVKASFFSEERFSSYDLGP